MFINPIIEVIDKIKIGNKTDQTIGIFPLLPREVKKKIK